VGTREPYTSAMARVRKKKRWKGVGTRALQDTAIPASCALIACVPLVCRGTHPLGFKLCAVASSSPSFLCAGPFDFAFFILYTLSLGIEYRSSINVLYSLYSSKVKGNFFNKTHYFKKMNNLARTCHAFHLVFFI